MDSFDFVAITSCHGKYHFGSPLLSPFILENKSLLGIKHLVGLLNGMASSPRQINSLHSWCEIRNEAERAGKRWVKTKQRKSTCGEERSGGVARLLVLPISVYSMYCICIEMHVNIVTL